jgi:hypothetical protein
MNDMNYTTWTEDELRLVHAYKNKILEESGGNGISKNSPSLKELQSLCVNRSDLAVHHKVRSALVSEGALTTRKQMLARIKAKALQEDVVAERLDMEAAPAPDRNSIFDYTSKEPVIVSVPLSKLYGKVDFHTFMSLINE